MGEGLISPGRFAVEAIVGVVAGYELVQVPALERILLEREVHVGAQVVDPELLGPRLFARRLLVEEQHVRLHALGVEDARGQARQRVHIRLLEQLAADGLARPALEQHVVRHDYGRAAVLFERAEDVLHEVELLVARRRPEVVADESSASPARARRPR